MTYYILKQLKLIFYCYQHNKCSVAHTCVEFLVSQFNFHSFCSLFCCPQFTAVVHSQCPNKQFFHTIQADVVSENPSEPEREHCGAFSS